MAKHEPPIEEDPWFAAPPTASSSSAADFSWQSLNNPTRVATGSRHVHLEPRAPYGKMSALDQRSEYTEDPNADDSDDGGWGNAVHEPEGDEDDGGWGAGNVATRSAVDDAPWTQPLPLEEDAEDVKIAALRQYDDEDQDGPDPDLGWGSATADPTSNDKDQPWNVDQPSPGSPPAEASRVRKGKARAVDQDADANEAESDVGSSWIRQENERIPSPFLQSNEESKRPPVEEHTGEELGDEILVPTVTNQPPIIEDAPDPAPAPLPEYALEDPLAFRRADAVGAATSEIPNGVDGIDAQTETTQQQIRLPVHPSPVDPQRPTPRPSAPAQSSAGSMPPPRVPVKVKPNPLFVSKPTQRRAQLPSGSTTPGAFGFEQHPSLKKLRLLSSDRSPSLERSDRASSVDSRFSEAPRPQVPAPVHHFSGPGISGRNPASFIGILGFSNGGGAPPRAAGYLRADTITNSGAPKSMRGPSQSGSYNDGIIKGRPNANFEKRINHAPPSYAGVKRRATSGRTGRSGNSSWKTGNNRAAERLNEEAALYSDEDGDAVSPGTPDPNDPGGLTSRKRRRKAQPHVRQARDLDVVVVKETLERNRDFGPVEGVEIGALFDGRKALREAGMHNAVQRGIYSKVAGALCIVASGGYEGDDDMGEWMWYTGEGGKEAGDPYTYVKDQVLTQGNKGLDNSIGTGTPVRVVRGGLCNSLWQPKIGKSKASNAKLLRYDGLYRVCYRLDDTAPGTSFRLFKFLLHRLPDQAPLPLPGAFRTEAARKIGKGWEEARKYVPNDPAVVEHFAALEREMETQLVQPEPEPEAAGQEEEAPVAGPSNTLNGPDSRSHSLSESDSPSASPAVERSQSHDLEYLFAEEEGEDIVMDDD